VTAFAPIAAERSVLDAHGTDPNKRVVTIAAALFIFAVVYLSEAFHWRQATLFVIGGVLGLVLYHAMFGFTSAWRVFLSDRRGAGLRAQMLMLTVATLLFLPALAEGSLFGRPIVGAVAPVGLSVVFGAFLFGIGMQLGGGCASGTLYTAGSGNTRMIVTLAAFIAGSLIATLHMPWWLEQPNLGAISLASTLGLFPAIALQIGLFAAIAALSVVLERRRHGRLVDERPTTRRGLALIVRGPWPWIWGALGLALLNFATLAVAGHPWGITYGFTLWGAKIAAAAGIDVGSWTFWTWPYHRNALGASVLANSTSVMNFGILLGALLAVGLAGKFAPAWRIPWRSVGAAIIGGLLMGYGARLAFGCNIGAFFSGVASASVHGWVWFAAAFVGSVIGVRLRPVCGLAVERTRPTGC
jgi:uncharacterized protein